MTQSPLPVSPTPQRTKPLVLATDDDRSLQMLLKVAMTQQGFEVAQASSGEQCLRDYQRLKPDMILLDAVMPGMDGFECCRQIRQLPGSAQIPILMITVLDDPESVSQAFEAGATDYVTKPIYWAVLSHRVQRLLDSYKVAQQAQQNTETLSRYQMACDLQQQALQHLQSLSFGEFLAWSLPALGQFLQSDRALLYLSPEHPWNPRLTEFPPELRLNPTEEAPDHPDLTPTLSGLIAANPTPALFRLDNAPHSEETVPLDPALQSLMDALKTQGLCLCSLPSAPHPSGILFGLNPIPETWLDLDSNMVKLGAQWIAIAAAQTDS